MAHYKKRPKVKRYRRSFYSREMKLKKGIGIAVLVLAVLGIGWLAAPHVLDWATHTWYTVVRNRDLSASSPAVSEAASSTAASEAAASSVAEPEPAPEPEPTPGTAIVAGSWAEVDVTTLTDEAAITAAALPGACSRGQCGGKPGGCGSHCPRLQGKRHHAGGAAGRVP